MKPSEWIKKLADKDMSKEPFLAISEKEEVKKLDERFIDREELNEIIDKCSELKTWTDKEDKSLYKKKVIGSEDYVIIGIASKEELKNKLGIKEVKSKLFNSSILDCMNSECKFNQEEGCDTEPKPDWCDYKK